MKVRNTFAIFLVSGFWHGANWNFVAWGALNALYFLPLLLLKRNRTNLGVVAEGRMLPSLRELFQMGTTFLLTVLAWVFFRAESITMALGFIKGIVSQGLLQVPVFNGRHQAAITILLVLGLLTVEWVGRNYTHPLHFIYQIGRVKRWIIYLGLFIGILFFRHSGQGIEFIYFQF